MVNMRSPVSSWGSFAMEILEPDSRRISVIFVPFRPMMQPTMSEGMEMFCVRRLVGGEEEGELGEGDVRRTSPLLLRFVGCVRRPDRSSPAPGWKRTVPTPRSQSSKRQRPISSMARPIDSEEPCTSTIRSVDCGSISLEATIRAPDESWMALIFKPLRPITLPMRL